METIQVGSKIRENRNSLGLTQKELADRLNVTPQAVCRWENGDVEPNIATLKQMASIFHCSVDDLLSDDVESASATSPKSEAPQLAEIVVTSHEVKPVLAVCECCNRPIYEGDEIVRFTTGGHNVSRHRVPLVNHVYCSTCNERRLKQLREEKEAKNRAEVGAGMKRRVRSFVWPSIIVVLLFALCLAGCLMNQYPAGKTTAICVLVWVLWPYLACLFLQNNFIGDMSLEMFSWGFVKMPGVIFSLDFDGVVFLIAAKIFFFLLGIGLALLAGLAAVAVGSLCGLFVYPYAIAKNFKDPANVY